MCVKHVPIPLGLARRFSIFYKHHLSISSMLNLGIFPFFLFYKSLFLYRSQASEDATRIVDEERTNACMEIENARGAVQRVQKVLKEEENSSQR